MQTILGSNGAIGTALAAFLPEYTKETIRLVSRNPQKINERDQILKADLLDRDALYAAMEGSSVVYITVGFAYDTKVWQANWPVFMKNVIDIATELKCKLVFFDNIYMYDPNHLSPMDETTPINPSSQKGKVRQAIFEMLMDAVASKKVAALVARSADFYGPHIKNTSMLTETLFKPLRQGKKANILMSEKAIHSFSYVPDIARAVAILGNSDSAYDQVWHLPTAPNPLTMKAWVETVAKAFGVKPRYQVASNFILSILGLFIPIMRELKEMAYQFDRDYVFDSSKFEKAFDFKPTPYAEGIKEVIKKEFT